MLTLTWGGGYGKGTGFDPKKFRSIITEISIKKVPDNFFKIFISLYWGWIRRKGAN